MTRGIPRLNTPVMDIVSNRLVLELNIKDAAGVCIMVDFQRMTAV